MDQNRLTQIQKRLRLFVKTTHYQLKNRNINHGNKPRVISFCNQKGKHSTADNLGHISSNNLNTTMSQLNQPQYSYLRQSLRHMPPTNNVPSSAKDRVPQTRVRLMQALHEQHEHRPPPPTTSPPRGGTHTFRKSIRNITKRMGRRKDDGGRIREVESSYDSASSSFSTSNHDYSDYSNQYASRSEDSYHYHQQRWPKSNNPSMASHYGRGIDCRDDHIIDAEVRRSRDEQTFDYDYHNYRRTFDQDYTRPFDQGNTHQREEYSDDYRPTREQPQQPQTLPTLQQHLARERDDSPDEVPKPALTSPRPKKPSERYAERKNSIECIDPTLFDDIVRGAQEGGEKVSMIMALEEMGLKSSLQKSMPDWADDVLGAQHESLDPEVLKELVFAASIGDDDGKDAKCGEELQPEIQAQLMEDAAMDRKKPAIYPKQCGKPSAGATKVHAQQKKAARKDDDRKPSAIPQKQPWKDVKVTQQQHHDEKKKVRPSAAVAHDMRGPIPPPNGILSSITSSMASEPKRRVSTVSEDKRGPIPNYNIVDIGGSIETSAAVVAGASDDKKGQTNVTPTDPPGTKGTSSTVVANISIYDVSPPASGGAFFAGKGINNIHEKKEDETPKQKNRESLDSSSYGEILSRTSGVSSSYSYDQKPPPSYNQRSITPIFDRKPPSQSTMQSIHNQSASFNARGNSEHPWDEETKRNVPMLPPSLRHMSSSLSSFGDDQKTKPSLGFLANSRVHPACMHCDGDEVQAKTTKMRLALLESIRSEEIANRMKRRRKRPTTKRLLSPINI